VGLFHFENYVKYRGTMIAPPGIDALSEIARVGRFVFCTSGFSSDTSKAMPPRGRADAQQT
jgi:hypothetical protein